MYKFLIILVFLIKNVISSIDQKYPTCINKFDYIFAPYYPALSLYTMFGKVLSAIKTVHFALNTVCADLDTTYTDEKKHLKLQVEIFNNTYDPKYFYQILKNCIKSLLLNNPKESNNLFQMAKQEYNKILAFGLEQIQENINILLPRVYNIFLSNLQENEDAYCFLQLVIDITLKNNNCEIWPQVAICESMVNNNFSVKDSRTGWSSLDCILDEYYKIFPAQIMLFDHIKKINLLSYWCIKKFNRLKEYLLNQGAEYFFNIQYFIVTVWFLEEEINNYISKENIFNISKEDFDIIVQNIQCYDLYTYQICEQLQMIIAITNGCVLNIYDMYQEDSICTLTAYSFNNVYEAVQNILSQ